MVQTVLNLTVNSSILYNRDISFLKQILGLLNVSLYIDMYIKIDDVICQFTCGHVETTFNGH